MEKRLWLGLLFISTLCLGFMFGSLNNAIIIEPVGPYVEQPSSSWKGHSTMIVLYDDGSAPNTVIISPRDAVVWRNEGSADRRFWLEEKMLSDIIKPGKEFSYVFERAGNYTFRDAYNARITGTVIVRPVQGTSLTGYVSRMVPARYHNVVFIQFAVLVIAFFALTYPYGRKEEARSG